jgi:hypothetical protein
LIFSDRLNRIGNLQDLARRLLRIGKEAGLSGVAVARCRKFLGLNTYRADRRFGLCDMGATWADEDMHMVVASTSVERDHFISRLQLGQLGESNCSNDLLSLSTMSLPFLR